MARERRGSAVRWPGAWLATLALLAAGPARAEAPLYLRIRAHPDPAAAREAVWLRSQIRARAVIASICTGCLAPWRETELPAAPPARPPAASPDRGVHERPAALSASAGLEGDTLLQASEPTSEPPIRERRP